MSKKRWYVSCIYSGVSHNSEPHMKFTALIIGLMLAFNAQATWYKTTGSAPIIDGDDDFARQMAVQDAIKQAMLNAGASLSSIQSIKNGVVTQDDFQVRANSEVRQYQLLSEEIKDKRMMVTVRSFIVADRSGCAGGLYAKDIAMVRFNWLNKDDARYGQIYQLDRILTKNLFDRFGQQRRIFVAQHWLDNNLGIYPGRIEQGDPAFKEQVKDIALQTDSQFLVLGTITDASIEQPKQGIVDSILPNTWFVDPLRKFTLQLYLFDGLTGQLLEKPFYQTQAHWTFDRDAIVDPSSQTFWQSSYGMEINSLLSRVTEEFNARLQCQRPTARIIRIDGLDYHINLGKVNGLKVGDRFRILHKADYQDEYGATHTLRNAADGLMEVKKVYAENAVLRPLSQYVAGNIQLSDLAELE